MIKVLNFPSLNDTNYLLHCIPIDIIPLFLISYYAE